MADLLIPKSSGARKRLRILYHGMFVLLALHFALVYLAPEYLLRSLLQQQQMHMLGTINPPQSKVMEKEDGTRMLWAGEREEQHFDITEFRLNPEQLHYGLGREAFPALIEPRFVSAEAAEEWLEPKTRVLVVKIEDEAKVYPVPQLTRHEVVNDVVGGVPVFAAYCILADLGAVYDRRMDGHTLTFGVAGYTYADEEVWDGMEAFVLWDRDTESLWWPPIGRAVSGPLIDKPMKVLDQEYWAQTTWSEAKEKYPDAVVLESGQQFERPKSWPALKIAATPSNDSMTTDAPTTQPTDSMTDAPTTQPAESLAEMPTTQPSPGPTPDDAIAPRWGENAAM